MVTVSSPRTDRHAQRILTLRSRCLERKRQGGPSTVLANARGFRAGEGRSLQIRRAMATREILRSTHFLIDDLELLIGRPEYPQEDPRELEEAQAYLAENMPPSGGQTGHCELDRSRIFNLGIDALCREIETYEENSSEKEEQETYQSFLIALEGLAELVDNALSCIRKAQKDAAPERLRELQELLAVCHHIRHHPPETFRQAIQLSWFMDFAVMHGESVGLVVSGRLDRRLLPFYQQDVAAGRLDQAEALALIESLYLLTNEFIRDGLAMSVMVGGRNANGEDCTNDLSHLCLEALRRTALVYPTVGICWHEETPESLSQLAIELIASGNPNPAFFSDETIQRGLRALGAPPEDSCDYINSTCVEITPCSSSNVWVASPYFPTTRLLREEFIAQSQGNSPAKDFPAFLEAYKQRLGNSISNAVAAQRNLRDRRRDFGRKPLQSLFTRDCLDKGRDIDDGGARYNWCECSFVGLANTADSLRAIREEVYRQKNLTFQQFAELLENDFANAEEIRQRLLSHPKYGNGDSETDSYVNEIVQFARAECARHKLPPDNAHFVPGAFCWIMHERLGRETGATPDGRPAGTPFADGCGPAQGRERCGPTTAILSTTSWDHAPLIGGAACNLKFSHSLLQTKAEQEKLKQLVMTYLRRGGFETQINVINADKLRQAKADPAHYRDLVVRIGGYTDYFANLSDEMQNEVIQRTEFAVL